MLQPKKVKYRKVHRARSELHGKSKGDLTLAFGAFGLKAVSTAEVNSRQIEAARKAINNSLERQGKVWIRVFPQKAITQKAAEVPMGSGKGSLDHYVCPVQPGKILFELGGVTEEKARKALYLGMHKLPVSCKFVTNEL